MWYIYMIRCEDGSIYTGITPDIENRMKAHASGKGAKYTASHKPKELLCTWATDSRSNASKLESRIKKLSKPEKESVAAGKTDVFEIIELDGSLFCPQVLTFDFYVV